ncbi:MAG: IS91 family transposase, partial [Nitrospirae bacterium CG_4_9_14_3_um_filter_53_35]
MPHRQYVFTVPILLRVYFKYDRRLLSKLCRSAYESLLIFLRTTLKLPHGIPGCIMTIQTFGEYPDRFHPHLHALVSDELFKRAGTFYVMPKVDLKFLEEIFRAKVLGMLKAEGKIGDETIRKLLIWRHSGFNVHNGVRIRRSDAEGRERLSRYILRNTFSVEKMSYAEETGHVIYQSKMTHGKNKKNFEVYEA